MEKVRTDKRFHLIETAIRLIYQHGFNQTTLADIARQPEVPLGNVYYYFKTKEELGSALIEHRADSYRGLTDAWSQLPDPRQRILSLIQTVRDQREILAQSGCPVGSLCQELNKHGGPLAEKSATLLAAHA
ncbi:MAG: TetR/AcrR family transcriptional regulator [Sulfuricaulis sp.]|nr:TetR/AcrR family transcriptional regulator [Sulfuricaulis sp.]